MFRIPWAPPLTKAQLQAIADPQTAGQPEVVPWIMYDTQTFTSASTVSLTFFQTVQTDRTLGNMQSQGQLPDPQYLVIHYVTCDILNQVSSSAGVIAGAANDVELLMKVGRPVFTLTMSDKIYGPFPLRACHSLGGATGIINGTYTAPIDLQQANNGIPGSGGYPFCGAVVIPPKVGFKLTVDWSAAQTLTGNANIQIGLAGALYRRVL